MNQQIVIVQAYAQSINQQYAALKDEVDDAVATADAFYETVQGPQGIISWISDTFGLRGSLCGNTDPDFCDFNPVS
jgi:lysophospholipase L1-like esterase